MLFTYESMNKRREGHQNKSTSTFCCLAASEARAACLLPVCILPGGTFWARATQPSAALQHQGHEQPACFLSAFCLVGHQGKSNSTFCCLATSDARAACLLPVCILPGGTSRREQLNLLLPCNIRGNSCLPASYLHSVW